MGRSPDFDGAVRNFQQDDGKYDESRGIVSPRGRKITVGDADYRAGQPATRARMAEHALVDTYVGKRNIQVRNDDSLVRAHLKKQARRQDCDRHRKDQGVVGLKRAGRWRMGHGSGASFFS